MQNGEISRYCQIFKLENIPAALTFEPLGKYNGGD
jgi:hypothetical protein